MNPKLCPRCGGEPQPWAHAKKASVTAVWPPRETSIIYWVQCQVCGLRTGRRQTFERAATDWQYGEFEKHIVDIELRRWLPHDIQ